MKALQDFLRATSALPFTWGKLDCMLWPCAAVAAVTGNDPAKDLRGTYTTRSEALSIVKREGGLIKMAERRVQPLIPRNDEAEHGVCLVHHNLRLQGGIVSAGRVLVKSDNSAIVLPDRPVMAWGF